MRTQLQKAEAFRALHARPGAFIIPNPWDVGTARILERLGFEALALFYGTDESWEGRNAFREKRKPGWYPE